MRYVMFTIKKICELAMFVAFHKYTLALSVGAKCWTAYLCVTSATTQEELIWRSLIATATISTDLVWYAVGLWTQKKKRRVAL